MSGRAQSRAAPQLFQGCARESAYVRRPAGPNFRRRRGAVRLLYERARLPCRLGVAADSPRVSSQAAIAAARLFQAQTSQLPRALAKPVAWKATVKPFLPDVVRAVGLWC